MAKPITVLLADADEQIFGQVQNQLVEQSALEYDIQWVQNVSELAQQLRATPVDICLIADEIADGLTYRPTQTSFVVLTQSHEHGASRVMELGVQDYLSKHQLHVELIERSIRYALDRRQSEAQLMALAHLDQLTGLPNRNHFHQRLSRCLNETKESGLTGAFLVINVDRFRIVNDVYGSRIGDEIIMALGNRIRFYASDEDNVARLSGDEFVLLITREHAAEEAVDAASGLIGGLSQPIQLKSCTPTISCSVGITVFPSDGDSVDELIRNGDAALTAARSRGPGNYQSYSDNLGRDDLERHSLEARLHRAVAKNEFLLHYQPQMDLKTNTVIGLEALLRWNEPDGKTMSPARFVPVLEDTGLIVPVGEWVLRTACEQQLAWKRMGLGNIRMGVNVSAVQFAREDLLETVVRALEDYPLDDRKLELEITEGFLIDDIDKCRSTLEKLRSLGVRIAIDDFGTGYSSLMYLRRLPIDVLKIDRSFVGDVGEDPDATAIVSAIIALAHKLQIEVIAEGVETEAQRDFLRDEGCEVGQGYLFSPPLPAVWQGPPPSK